METREHIVRLEEERRKLIESSRAILEKAAEEKRDLTDEEETNYQQADTDIEKMAGQLERWGKQAEREAQETEVSTRMAGIQTETATGGRTVTTDEAREARVKDAEFRSDALNAWARAGLENIGTGPLKKEYRDALDFGRAESEDGTQHFGPTVRLRSPKELRRLGPLEYKGQGHWGYRAAQTVTTTGGGDVIQDEAMAAIETALLQFGGMRQSGAEVIRTATGADWPWPTINDTGTEGRLLAINTTVTNTALVYGQVVLGAFKYTSDSVLVPIELLQDSSFDYNTHVAERLGERVSRITNRHFTTGTGSSQPNGAIRVGNAAVKTVASASAITADELIEFQGDLDDAYTDDAVFMWKKATQTVVRKLKDGDNRYLWAPGTNVSGLGQGTPDLFLGDRVVVNQHLHGIGADKRSVLYGNFRRGYKIRDVMTMTLHRLVERYMDDGQVGFIIFSRHDGDIVDAGTNPIHALRHPAS